MTNLSRPAGTRRDAPVSRNEHLGDISDRIRALF